MRGEHRKAVQDEDELKDKDIDRAMFRDRPLPSGRVRESDIIISLTAAIALYLVANLWAGSAFWVALFVLGYALLMFCHFFMPGVLRDSLLLTLATHNPLFPILVLYGFSMFATQNGHEEMAEHQQRLPGNTAAFGALRRPARRNSHGGGKLK